MARRATKNTKQRTMDELDQERVALPGVEGLPSAYARYEVSAAGRVYRDDGRLLTPSAGQNGAIKINLNGGRRSRSLPRVVYEAFATVEPPDDGRTWDPWVDPMGPLDEATKRLRISVYDVVLVPHGDLIRYGKSPANTITERLAIVKK